MRVAAATIASPSGFRRCARAISMRQRTVRSLVENPTTTTPLRRPRYRSLDALSAPSRLATFRKLTQYRDSGIPSTDLAAMLGIPQNTISTQLQILAAAHLVVGKRDGRRVIYRADTDAIGELMEFLGKECTRGELRVEPKPRAIPRNSTPRRRTTQTE